MYCTCSRKIADRNLNFYGNVNSIFLTLFTYRARKIFRLGIGLRQALPWVGKINKRRWNINS